MPLKGVRIKRRSTEGVSEVDRLGESIKCLGNGSDEWRPH